MTWWRQSNARTAPDDNEAAGGWWDSVPLALLWLDKNGRIARANAAFETLFNDDWRNGLAWAQLAHPDDAARDRDLIAQLWRGATNNEISEQRLFHRNGEMLWGRVTWRATHATPAHKGHPTLDVVSLLVTIEDITRRKNAEDELAATRASLHDLYGVVADDELEMMGKVRALLTLGRRRFGVETALLARVCDDRFQIIEVVSADERLRANQTHALETPAGTTDSGEQLQHPGGPRGLVHARFETDWRAHPIFVETERETYLGAPVVVDGAVFGTLNFSDAEPRAAPFSDDDTQFLQLMARWLGGEIERQQARLELEKKQRELEEANARLEALATQDGLTGVKNRRAFDEQLGREWQRAKRYGTPLSLLLLDVDKFKQFNDSFGHPAGDEVLKRVAKILADGVRNIDFVARYGGEEFVILLPNTDSDGAMILAERLRTKIESAPWLERGVTASFGAASVTSTMSEQMTLIQAADGALYRSKERGRNRVTHANDGAGEEAA